MNVFVTGASGFIGSYVVRTLLEADHSVRALYRKPPQADLPEGLSHVVGSVTDPTSLEGLTEGCQAVVNLVGIIEEMPEKGITFDALHDKATGHVIAEARRSGVATFVQMSANGARENGVSAYQTSKWRAEQRVTNAGFERWTIFRPSLVFGDPGPGKKEFAVDLAKKLIKPFPVLPIFGDGQYRMQPIHVMDIASAIADAVSRSTAGGRTYGVGGREALPYVEIVDRITAGLGLKPKPKLHQPIWLARPVIRSVGSLGLLPISIDQFEMLIEGNTCDTEAFYADFEVREIPFSVEELAYVGLRAG